MTMNDVERAAAQMGEKKKRPLRCIARDHDWLMPCYQFDGNSVEVQFGKVLEEVEEVVDAYDRYCDGGDHEARINLLTECADIQQMVETLMHLLGAGAMERTMARRLAWEKNNARSYFKRKRKE